MTIHDLINILDPIPKEQWCEDKLIDDQGRSCIMGHLGVRGDRPSIPGLWKDIEIIFGKIGYSPVAINNGLIKNYTQDNPKDRVMAALYDIKKLTN